MRLFFVDQVLELHRFEGVSALLHLSPDDEVFRNHFPAEPMLPASMTIESLAQAATVLLEASSGFTRKAVPGYLRNAKFHRPVRPGAPLRLDMRVLQLGDDGAMIQGLATQGGARCAHCEMGMVMFPIERFYRPEHAAAYRTCYSELLAGAHMTGFAVPPEEELRHAIAG